MTQNARKSSPIFNAEVTFNNSFFAGTTAKGVAFRKSQGATLKLADGREISRTVMAFGDQLAPVKNSLRKGRTVKLAVQHDGGSVKVIGFQRDKIAAAA